MYFDTCKVAEFMRAAQGAEDVPFGELELLSSANDSTPVQKSTTRLLSRLSAVNIHTLRACLSAKNSLTRTSC